MRNLTTPGRMPPFLNGFVPFIFLEPALEEAFQYLVSFATQSVLEEALSIVKRNEHYKMGSQVACCKDQSHFPQNLADRMNDILGVGKARNALISEVLTFLSKVLVDLMLEYTTCDIPPNRSNSSAQCLIS